MTTSQIPNRTMDDQLTSRLLHQRIIVLGQEVDDPTANRLCAALLLLSGTVEGIVFVATMAMDRELDTAPAPVQGVSGQADHVERIHHCHAVG